jgi:hypothetical protein
LGTIGLAPICTTGTAKASGQHKDGGPMTGPFVHFCGIHMAKKDPKIQFITQHFCAAHTGTREGDIFQCVLFDGIGKNARMIGVEYLISDAAYRKLPDAEKNSGTRTLMKCSVVG